MISLLAIVVTAVLLASALVWRAVLILPLAGARLAAIFRGLLHGGAILIDRLFASRLSPNAGRNRRMR
jgi:hypothetical protein